MYLALLVCGSNTLIQHESLLISALHSGDPRLQQAVMEFLDLLYLAIVAILAIFVAGVFVFIFLQWWSWLGHGDGLQQKEKTVILQRKEPHQKKKFAGKKFGGRPSTAAGGQAKAASGSGSGFGSGSGGLTHSEQARVGSGLCHFHWTHGAKANKCVAPCS